MFILSCLLHVSCVTSYYLQVALHIMYGLIVGLAFYKLDTVLNDIISYLPGQLLLVPRWH
jgi:hypothetical protein